MDFGFYYRPDVNRVLFNYAPSAGGGPCCYDTVVSESRIVDYIGIARGQLPQKEYYGRWRTFPDDCATGAFQETRPVGVNRTYFGVPVFEGAYPYDGMLVTPSWGGSMFEALMPALFVPEETLGAAFVGRQPPADRARADLPRDDRGRLRRLGLLPVQQARGRLRRLRRRRHRDGPERQRRPTRTHTLIDHGFPGCPNRPAVPDPPASDYTNGVVTPHAAFLALRYAPADALSDLARLRVEVPGDLRQVGLPRQRQRARRARSPAPTSRSTRG